MTDMPKQITLEVHLNSDGTINESKIISELEAALQHRVKITDWVSESMLMSEYPHLTDEQRRGTMFGISEGDYDDAIDRDIRSTVITEAIRNAGAEPYPSQRKRPRKGP